jgi:hypothetical protein
VILIFVGGELEGHVKHFEDMEGLERMLVRIMDN